MNPPEFPQTLREIYDFLTVCIVITLSSIVGMLRRHQDTKSWMCFKFFIDLFVSVMTGFIAFILLIGLTHNDWLAVGGASYCGHLGPRSLDYLLERLRIHIKPKD